FSYVVLGAGFFTTQKAQETVHTGVSQATSAVEPSGPVSVKADSDSTIGTITFYLQLAAGGSGVDMSKVTYTVSTPKLVKTFTNSSVSYNWVKVQSGTDSAHTAACSGSIGASNCGILSAREMVLVTVTPDFAANMGPNDKFIVEVKPPIGAALPISRTIPGGLVTDQVYEVF
ncbi:MAG: flagellin, partial [Methanoregula sp.]|nr:flagellin [Methanoregula sp.]